MNDAPGSAAAPHADDIHTAAAPEAGADRAAITGVQWRSGIAAWLGWLFDGLDMHLYTLVATPFVAELMTLERADPQVKHASGVIQAAFLVGWALGGAFFGRIGDRIGRSRALVLTILTYAAFTGLSFVATDWWHLLVFRFLAALGIGGEWAVGAALLAETWPGRLRPWLAAVLQSAVNIGILAAGLCVAALGWLELPSRWVFLIGVLPALIVVWIRRAVPETEQWHAARSAAARPPGIRELFRGPVRRTTLLTVLVCALGLTAHWAFMFWWPQHLHALPEVQDRTAGQKQSLVSLALALMMIAAIAGNFLAGAIARRVGYRWTLAAMFVAYGATMLAAYAAPRGLVSYCAWLAALGVCSGVFAPFTMYLPPLFPTLLRTTGAGFSYNIGRIAAAAGTVVFGLYAPVADMRLALLATGFLFLPAAAVSLAMPQIRE
jgi:MFS family permease